MNEKIVVPVLGESITEATVSKWLKNEGDTVDQDVTIFIIGTNDTPVITSAAQAGTITESVDAVTVPDADPADATGTITFDDVDLSDTHTVSTTSSVVLSSGIVLDAAQEASLLADLSS